LPHREALDIACQLCAGLAEAHNSGIIHRDLKSANIFLCQNGDGTCRAVITDFGLASRVNGDGGDTGGTPAYMAPELWEGESASIASDIYALGVMFYEMVAGRTPHLAETSQPSLSRFLSANDKEVAPERIVPPSTWTHALDPRWDRVVMHCLESSPADRPPDVSTVLQELKKEPIRKWPFLTAGAICLLISAIFLFVRPVRQWAADVIWPPNIRLAVLPFEGPKEMAAVGGGALQALAERIQQLPSDRMWPLSKLSRAVEVIPPSRTTYLQADTAQRARDVLHATHALKVNVQRHDDGKLTAHAIVIDLSSQMPIQELSVPYEPNDMGNMSLALGHFLAKAFRLRERSSEDRLSAAAEAPYLSGLYFLNRDVHSFSEAMAQFQEAARLDSNSALPPAGMALAKVQQFKETQQKSCLLEAQNYLSIAQGRNPDSIAVLTASARVNRLGGHLNRAEQDYKRILELEPRNIDALLGIGWVYQSLDEPREAIAAFHKAQEIDPESYRPYQVMGEFYQRQGRYTEAAEEFRKAVARAPGFFDGYSSLGAVLVEMERFDEAEQALQKSLHIRETAQGLNNMGALRAFQRRYEEAAEFQKKALAYQPRNSDWILNLADDLRWAGRPEEAKVYYGKAKDMAFAEMTLDPGSAAARALYAYFWARLGDPVRARQEISQAINFAPGDNEVLRRGVMTYEATGDRELALETSQGMTAAELKLLIREPDLADFCRDSRFTQQIAEKGGQ
jgi:serine/threonine-protein kinase